MVLIFLDLANLLETLERIERPNTQARLRSVAVDVTSALTPKLAVQRWFKQHRRAIDELSAPACTALLSAFLPERRTDRVYGLQATSLSSILGRCLGLSASRVKDLLAYREPGNGDLAECLERILRAGGTQALPAITLEDLDDLCNQLASASHFSAPEHRAKHSWSFENRNASLKHIFSRASPLEGKWLVRLLLKDLSPANIDEYTVIRSMHFLLWDVLRFQNNFAAAFAFLKGEITRQDYPSDPDERSIKALKSSVVKYLKPAVGVKVGRPHFFKARSIDHCLSESMLGRREWCLERKYDGEYCEIHIECSDRPAKEWLKIYSKSGKDSTSDRKALHRTLIDCLRLGKAGCKIRKQAILLGELVVWDDDLDCVAPFDKIRKHVSRSGVFLGIDQDSQPAAHQHLAIVFFDLLLWDDDVVLRKPVNERRTLLRSIYQKLHGRAFSAEWKTIDFGSDDDAQKKLMEQFAASIAQRCEGLVLKPCNSPYFALHEDLDQGTHAFIKLKKDYMEGMGDEVDFAVIGGGYNPQVALRSGCRGIRWTDFYLGCLTNAVDVLRFDRKPHYKVVGILHALEGCIPKHVLKAANQLGSSSAIDYKQHSNDAAFDIDLSNMPGMREVFTQPFVFEVLGSSFVKPPNCDFLMLRHPRVKKLHLDRTWRNCTSFQDLQNQANAALLSAECTESQDTRLWLKKMTRKLKRKEERKLTMPQTASTPSQTNTTPIANISDRSDRSALDATPIVEASSLKRKRGPSIGTDCSSYKRACRGNMILSAGHDPANKASNRAVLEQTSPLADITNRISKKQPPLELPQARDAKGNSSVVEALDRPAMELTSLNLLALNNSSCTRSACAFARSVILLAPCIISMPYITKDLLPEHDHELIRYLNDWDRASMPGSELLDVVEESQAYPARRKIVLVERQRQQVVKDIIWQILALNDGSFRERIEVYDWRILEACRRHDLTVDRAKAYLIGATTFDDLQKEAVFVPNVDWL